MAALSVPDNLILGGCSRTFLLLFRFLVGSDGTENAECDCEWLFFTLPSPLCLLWVQTALKMRTVVVSGCYLNFLPLCVSLGVQTALSNFKLLSPLCLLWVQTALRMRTVVVSGCSLPFLPHPPMSPVGSDGTE